jgi:hypothetical protein
LMCAHLPVGMRLWLWLMAVRRALRREASLRRKCVVAPIGRFTLTGLSLYATALLCHAVEEAGGPLRAARAERRAARALQASREQERRVEAVARDVQAEEGRLQRARVATGAAAVANFWAAVSTEIYICGVCSCQTEILRRKGRGQDAGTSSFGGACCHRGTCGPCAAGSSARWSAQR